MKHHDQGVGSALLAEMAGFWDSANRPHRSEWDTRQASLRGRRTFPANA
jgi:hypothetical protein